MTGGPPRGAHPRVLLASAQAQLGSEQLLAWCGRLIRGQDRRDDPDLGWLGGTEDWAPYWRRVWGARGLLYVWDESCHDDVEVALADEHWRVREMACKVARAHRLGALAGELASLRAETRTPGCGPRPSVR